MKQVKDRPIKKILSLVVVEVVVVVVLTLIVILGILFDKYID